MTEVNLKWVNGQNMLIGSLYHKLFLKVCLSAPSASRELNGKYMIDMDGPQEDIEYSVNLVEQNGNIQQVNLKTCFLAEQ